MRKHFNPLYLTDCYLGEGFLLRYPHFFDRNYFEAVKKEIMKYCSGFEIKKIITGRDALVNDFLAFLIDTVFMEEKRRAIFDVVFDILINPVEIYDFQKAEEVYRDSGGKDFQEFVERYLTEGVFEDKNILEPRSEVEERTRAFLKQFPNYLTGIKDKEKMLLILPEELTALFLKIFRALPLETIPKVFSLVVYSSRDAEFGDIIYDLLVGNVRRKFVSSRGF
ncbi:MAG: hypothetical protein AB7D02_02580 [Candidatus Paceibacterota bacterium]